MNKILNKKNKFNSKILPYSKNKVKIKDEVVPINEKINFKNFFNKKYLKKIIQYNKDDCYATLQIAEYLIKNQLKKY